MRTGPAVLPCDHNRQQIRAVEAATEGSWVKQALGGVGLGDWAPGFSSGLESYINGEDLTRYTPTGSDAHQAGVAAGYGAVPSAAGLTALALSLPMAGALGESAAVGGTEGLEGGLESSGRGLILPAEDSALTGTRTLGYTTPSGDVFLQPGLTDAQKVYVLEHESVHIFFSPSGTGPIAVARQSLGQWGYDNSQLLRYIEEAAAETYATGSLWQGLRFPLRNGYVTWSGLLLEGGVGAAGAVGTGYLGYRLRQ